MRKRQWIALGMAALLCLGSASAHSGRTDANGGHHVTATGEYHYHHGYPAHQHPGGVCPYTTNRQDSQSYTTDSAADESDRKDTPSTTYTRPSQPSSSSKADETRKLEAEKRQFWKNVLLCVLGFVFIVWPFLAIAGDMLRRRQKRNALPPKRSDTPALPPQAPAPKPQPIQPVCRTISKTEIDRMIRADAYREMCGGRSIWEMAGVPDGVYFDQWGLPHTSEATPEEDPFFVYVTPSGESYHLRTCRLAKTASPVNICRAIQDGKKPCKLCKPMGELPRFVTRYQELTRIQKDYGVDMLP